MYTMYRREVLTPTYPTVAAARADIKGMLDRAQTSVPVTIRRDGYLTAVIGADRLRELLLRSVPAKVRVGADDDGTVYAVMDGRPLAGSGASVAEALADLVDALREYADDWHDRLRFAPNHADNWDLVQLIGLLTDTELTAWLSA